MNRLDKIVEDIATATEQVEGFRMRPAQRKAYRAIIAKHIRAAELMMFLSDRGFIHDGYSESETTAAIQSFLDEEV
jgi:hypothetical protein